MTSFAVPTHFHWPAAVRSAVAIAAVLLSSYANAGTADLLRMSDQLDQMDKQDFSHFIEKADKCTRARDFSCAETQLRSARKLANTSTDVASLKNAEAGLSAGRQRVKDEEERIAAEQRREEELAERERQLELAEQRAAEDAEWRARQETVKGPTLGEMMAATAEQISRDHATFSAMAQESSERVRATIDERNRMETEARERQADVARQQREIRAEAERERQAAERARNAAERERLARKAEESMPKYQPQVVTIPKWEENCPAGSKTWVGTDGTRAVPGGALCVPDPKAGGATASQASSASTQSNSSTRTASANTSASNSPSNVDREAAKRAESEATAAAAKAAEQERNALDALAFCWEAKSGNWFCDGKIQETSMADKDMSAQLDLVGCKFPERITTGMVTLTSARTERGQKSGWLYRCGIKLEAGNTGSLTWNRDIRRLWNGIVW